MEGIVTWSTLWGVIGAIAAIVVACFAVWWRIENKVKEAKQSAYYKCDDAMKMADAANAKANLAREELSSYRTHVAEMYVSKQGHREANEQLMSAFAELRGDVRGIRDRIDNFIDHENKPTGRR